MSMISAMTWKGTAFVSGATVLATWLASVPPNRAPGDAAPVRASAGTSGEVSDIGQQAARLHAKLHQDIEYREPSRNLFRFTAAAPASRAAARRVAATSTDVAMPSAPEPLRIRLSGVASDKVGEREQRTAILSTPAGVVLAREGDEVGGEFRVGVIGEDAADLIRLDDGTVLRLEAR